MDNSHDFKLNLGAALPRVERHVEDVQLERIGASLFDQPSVGKPAAGSRSVEGRDHRDADGLLYSPEVVQVLVRPEYKRVGARKIARSFSGGIVSCLLVAHILDLLSDDLFFE